MTTKPIAAALVALALLAGCDTATYEEPTPARHSVPLTKPLMEFATQTHEVLQERLAEQRERSAAAAGARLTAEADTHFERMEALAAQEAAAAAEREAARVTAEEEARKHAAAAAERQATAERAEALREKEESQPQPREDDIFTTNVWTEGSQAELDQCRGAVVTRHYQRTVAWENGERHVAIGDPGVPWIAEHNHCGARAAANIPVGGKMRLTGLYAGTYKIVSEKTVTYGNATALAGDDVAGDYIFQTCYDDFDSSGRMRLMGLVKVS